MEKETNNDLWSFMEKKEYRLEFGFLIGFFVASILWLMILLIYNLKP